MEGQLTQWLLVNLPVGAALLWFLIKETRDHTQTKAEFKAYRDEIDRRNNALIENLGRGLEKINDTMSRLSP